MIKQKKEGSQRFERKRNMPGLWNGNDATQFKIYSLKNSKAKQISIETVEHKTMDIIEEEEDVILYYISYYFLYYYYYSTPLLLLATVFLLCSCYNKKV